LLVCLAVGAWTALQRRGTTAPAPPDVPHAPTVPAPAAPAAAPASPAAAPASPEAPAGPAAPGPTADGGTDARVEELARVSGLGRRSAEALVVAGITSLGELADSDDTALAGALDAAGLPHATTMSSWPGQARRLGSG